MVTIPTSLWRLLPPDALAVSGEVDVGIGSIVLLIDGE